MADRVRKVAYTYVTVPSRAGQGARLLGALRDASVDLLAYSGFPNPGGKAQIDLVAESMSSVVRVLRKLGLRPSRTKRGFLIHGPNRMGAVHRHVQKLADAGINITAADAVSAGRSRYAMILWVKPKDFARASRVLGAR